MFPGQSLFRPRGGGRLRGASRHTFQMSGLIKSGPPGYLLTICNKIGPGFTDSQIRKTVSNKISEASGQSWQFVSRLQGRSFQMTPNGQMTPTGSLEVAPWSPPIHRGTIFVRLWLPQIRHSQRPPPMPRPAVGTSGANAPPRRMERNPAPPTHPAPDPSPTSGPSGRLVRSQTSSGSA